MMRSINRIRDLPRIAIIVAVLIQIGIFAACSPQGNSVESVDSSSLDRAFEQRSKDVQVNGQGVVTRILPDDTFGTPHQRFIVRLASGHTVLIEHNIGLADRIGDLNEGDTVSFSGEYVWNEQGGLVHWTHHDPA